MIEAILTWAFIGFVIAFAGLLLVANFIMLATKCERPRWYIAFIHRIGKRIGLEEA